MSHEITVNGCSVTILPIIKGLVSESEKVVDALQNDYDMFAVALGPEEIEGIKSRGEIVVEKDECGDDIRIMSDIDLVYGKHLMTFGKINVPVPAYCTLIDTCAERSIDVIPLDMNDDVFSEIYCENVTTFELLREKGLVKKGLKKKFDLSSPEAFVEEWDDHVNTIKGFRTVSEIRERFIASQIIKNCVPGKKMLALIEHERIFGIWDILENADV
jgi:hypothetical protein